MLCYVCGWVAVPECSQTQNKYVCSSGREDDDSTLETVIDASKLSTNGPTICSVHPFICCLSLDAQVVDSDS